VLIRQNPGIEKTDPNGLEAQTKASVSALQLASTVKLLAVRQYDGMGLEHSGRWYELVQTTRYSERFGNGNAADPMGAWIGYEIASGEGYQVSGIDSYSDIIATEAGRLFAERMLMPNSPVVDKATFMTELDKCFKDAREAFSTALANTLTTSRKRAQNMLFGLTTAMDQTGTFYTGFNGIPPAPNLPIWKSTLGSMLDRIVTGWAPNSIQAREATLIADLSNHLSDVTKREAAFTATNGEALNSTQVRTLDDLIELLMFYGELP
jgi:hypothetical protein